MNINFELYKVFYYVANAKSISKGAENLNISQPAVTQSIKTLEDELNGKLFIRTPKGVILTHEGEILYNYIKEGMTCTQEEIDEFCMSLPKYKRPRKIIFAKVPRNPTGKIEKPKLRSIYCGESVVAQQNEIK